MEPIDYSKLTPVEFVDAARKDPEMDRWALSLLIPPGQALLYFGEDEKYRDATFEGFPKIYYGRLHNPGTKPGKYQDHTRALVKLDGETKIVPIERLTFSTALGNTLYQDLVSGLPENWHLIDLSRYYISELPDTKFMESDVVQVKEGHERYSESPYDNQYTVYRIDYDSAPDNTSYTLRAGKTLFEAKESELSFLSDGPVRIMQSRQHPLAWRSLKDEAEFHLLIGKYRRVFNPHSLCYRWDLKDPQQLETVAALRSGGVVDGILARKGYDELVTLDDRAVGAQVALAPDLVLDI